MSATLTYARTKSATTNATGIAYTLVVAEAPGALAVLTGGQAGTTAQLLATWRADADESGGTIIKDHVRLVITPSIDPTTSLTTYTIVATPVLGNGTLGTVQTLTVTHDEPMDTWQTNAGRARQP